MFICFKDEHIKCTLCYIFVTFIQTMKSTGSFWCCAIKSFGFKVHISSFIMKGQNITPLIHNSTKKEMFILGVKISIPNSGEKVVFFFTCSMFAFLHRHKAI